MRIEQLEYLEAVTRHGSLRRASESLHLSQPALSESIRTLERELGVPLIDRHRTGARISSQGRELLPIIGEVIEAVGRLRARADGNANAAATLRVATVNAGTSTLLVPTIRDFSASQPDTSIEVLNILQAEIYQGLLDGAIDIGLVNVLDGDDTPPRLQFTTLVRGTPVACFRADDPLAGRTTVTVDDLRQRPFVGMREGYLMHRFVSRLLGDRLPPGSCTTDGAENGKSLVAAGVGVTILPDYSVQGDPLELAGILTYRRVEGVKTSVTMLKLKRRTERVPASVSAFEDVLQHHVAHHPQVYPRRKAAKPT